jgi:threonine synthase
MVAREMGLPVKHFIAATNTNKVVPDFMQTGTYSPKKSVATISNAMDVGDPSNFIRILEMQNKDLKQLEKGFSSFSYSDTDTKEAMLALFKNYNYTADPHGAIGYLGLLEYQKVQTNTYGVFLETAHPVKFLEVVEETLGKTLTIPQKIVEVLSKQKTSIKIANYQGLKDYLML